MFVTLYRTRRKVRSILPAMFLLRKLLLKVVKELAETNYEIGVITICSACKKEQFLSYIELNPTDQSESLQCSKCRNVENISPNTALIKSKVRFNMF